MMNLPFFPKFRFSFRCAVFLLLAPLAFAQTLKQVAAFDLPGPAGKRFDYLTIDYDDHYLLSAHLAAGLLYVIDLKTNQVLKTIPDVPGVEGVEFVPELKKVYTSDYYENKIGVIDLKQMKVIKKLPTEAKPDGSAYAAPFHKLYVSDERGKAEAVVDVTKDEIIKTLKFDSETGMPQYDPVARKVYVNLQDQNIFAIIDPANDTVVARYPVGRCRGNHGMALDPEHHRAFLSCEGNKLMTVFDLDKHAPIAYLPLAPDPDVIKFDPGLKRIYAACYSGAISVFQEDDSDHYRKLEDFHVEQKMHSFAVDTETHRLYVPEEWVDGRPGARMAVYDALPSK
jgi:DNA-binding beta-propeller fold protein YncE